MKICTRACCLSNLFSCKVIPQHIGLSVLVHFSTSLCSYQIHSRFQAGGRYEFLIETGLATSWAVVDMRNNSKKVENAHADVIYVLFSDDFHAAEIRKGADFKKLVHLM